MRRYAAAASLAAVITVGLFLLMHALVLTRGGELDEKKAVRVIDFVRLRRESEVETKKRERPQPDRVEAPPRVPRMHFSQAGKPGQQIQRVMPAFDLAPQMIGGPSLSGTGSAASARDADTIPLVRINPQYPIHALSRGIEGWVEVRFTITGTGTVKDAVVIASEPGNIFDQAAVRAVRKWKYRPKIENGVAVERPGVVVRLTFKIENT